MPKTFNTTAVCIPEQHYMINLDKRLNEIKKLIDNGKYFTINRARQYGKTTTLIALKHFLEKEYYVVLIDFQSFGSADFESENVFALSFANSFLRYFKKTKPSMTEELQAILEELYSTIQKRTNYFSLKLLFETLSDICEACDKPLVLMIDEVDSASNNQIFIDFLSQLRAQYINRFQQAAFQSVILASVYDIKNLKLKIRSENEHKYNSPWNIAADLKIDMSFSKEEISEMLKEYEQDYSTGMDISLISGLLYDYTSGYPFLVSRLCQLIDEDVSTLKDFPSKNAAWTQAGFFEALRMILSEKIRFLNH